MTLYKLENNQLNNINEIQFSNIKILEKDLQNLIMKQPNILGEELLIISEEYSDWEESQKRVDLLAIDQDGNLVVIELKRDNGFHMDLQAIRYAAMLSQLTYDKAISTYKRFLQKYNPSEADQAEILINRFISGLNEDNGEFAKDIRIILVSNYFSKEITSSALWLRSKGVDMKCIKLTPYLDQETQAIYIDSDVIIPLREVDEYLIAIQDKKENQKQFRTSMSYQKDQTKYDFKGTIYGKGQLVLNVIRDFVNEHPEISFEQLKTAFPDSLQGSHGVIIDFDQAEDVNDLDKKHKRYFNKDDQIISLNNHQQILVCNQWGIGNINQFIEQVQKLYNNSNIIQRI